MRLNLEREGELSEWECERYLSFFLNQYNRRLREKQTTLSQRPRVECAAKQQPEKPEGLLDFAEQFAFEEQPEHEERTRDGETTRDVQGD